MNDNYVVLIIGSLVALFFWQRNKTRSAEALNENEEDKEKISKLNKDSIKNQALLEIEEEKRKNIEDESTGKKKSKLTLQDISDMFNKLNDRK